MHVLCCKELDTFLVELLCSGGSSDHVVMVPSKKVVHGIITFDREVQPVSFGGGSEDIEDVHAEDGTEDSVAVENNLGADHPVHVDDAEEDHVQWHVPSCPVP